jgi:hypothetical protein
MSLSNRYLNLSTQGRTHMNKYVNQTAINDTIDLIFNSTQKIIDGMELDSRKTNKDWVNQIALETGKPVAVVNGLVSLYLDNSREIKSRSGAFGGHFKIDPNKDTGSKPDLSQEN